MRIGILALQGAVEPHEDKLSSLGVTPVRIRRPSNLENLHGLIFPGGESSTMLHLLRLQKLWEPLNQWLDRVPALGVCAGSILLSKTVLNPTQDSFDRLDIEATRNAYGTQLESFIATLAPEQDWLDAPSLEAVFIRAPRLRSLSPRAKVLLRHGQDEVLIEQDNYLAASFHPELSKGNEIHRYFLEKCRSNT